MYNLIYFISTFLFWTEAQSANILAVPTIPLFSHQTIYQPIWKELSLRGHQVTVLTPHPLRDPLLVNLTEIDLSFTQKFVERGGVLKFMNKNVAPTDRIVGIYEVYREVVEAQLSHPSVQGLIKDQTITFDVVLVEFYYPVFYALSARFRCPLIGITSLHVIIPGHDALGNPSHPALHPDVFLPFSETRGFYERLYSTYYSVWFRIYHNYYMLPKLDKVARNYIMKDMPYLGDIEKNVSLLLLNVNPVLNVIRPNLPTVIPLGGVHIRKKKLPKVIWKELSLRGHQVTVLTPNPLKDPSLVNLTEIDLSFTYDMFRNNDIQTTMNKDLAPTAVVEQAYKVVDDAVNAQVAHPAVQKLIKDKSKKFDVLLVEFIHPVMLALSARFDCPMIGMTSFDAPLSGHDAVGNPSHPVVNPDMFLPFSSNKKLTFFERLYSTYYSIWFRIIYHFIILPERDKIARKYISEDMPYLGDIEKNVSLLFINVNPHTHLIRANVPAAIQLDGIFMKRNYSLPKDLQEELDSATQGVVYLSLGSNVRSATLRQELREKIISAVSGLPYKVFWKWEKDHLPGKPKNVVIRKWFPQQGVLGHKNVKVFLTQGGLQSMEEAIYYGVPLVGMPFLGDQPMNVKKMVNLGIAIGVDPDTVTKEELKSALIEVAENPKYRSKIKEIGEIISDVPMTGLEKAVWWTEYVIRHKGAKHLRSPAVDMPLYQYFLLDVLAFIIVVTLVLLFVLYRIVKLIGKFMKLVQEKKVKVA